MHDDAKRLIAAIRAIDPAEHATGSRDFGRGFNHALRLVLDVIDAQEDDDA